MILKGTKYLLYYVLVISFFSCQDKCNKLETRLLQGCSKYDEPCNLELEGVYDFDWEELVIVVGPRFSAELVKITGAEYDFDVVPDNTIEYVFLMDSSVVKTINSSCGDISFYKATKEKGFVKYIIESSMEYKKIIVEGKEYIDVLH